MDLPDQRSMNMRMIKIETDLAKRLLKRIDRELEIAEPEAFTPEAQANVENLWKMQTALKEAIEETKAVRFSNETYITEALAQGLKRELEKKIDSFERAIGEGRCVLARVMGDYGQLDADIKNAEKAEKRER